MLVNKLVDEGCLSDEIDRRVRNFDDLNEQLDADGMCEIICSVEPPFLLRI